MGSVCSIKVLRARLPFTAEVTKGSRFAFGAVSAREEVVEGFVLSVGNSDLSLRNVANRTLSRSTIRYVDSCVFRVVIV